MFRFASPDHLYLLIVLPVLVALYAYARLRRRAALRRYGSVELIRQLMPEVSVKRERLKFWLVILSIGLVIFVIAGPQFGSKLDTVKRKGIEIMVCLDVSNSMLADDIKPTRLEKAKQMLSRMTDNFSNDKVGMIVFAGDAFTQLPITSDYLSAKMFLSSVSPAMVSSQGTAIGAAINLALRSFTPSETSSKTIIIITDGENHEGDAVKAAQSAAERGITVNVVGIGSLSGVPIPIDGGQSYMKDRDGNVVVTQLNESMCQEIAAGGQGIYVRADNTNSAMRALQEELGKMDRTELDSKVYSEYDEQFQALAWIALILLVLEFLLLERRNRLFRKVKLFACILMLLVGSVSAYGQKEERSRIREGNKLYQSEQYTESELAYRKSLEANPRSLEGAYDLGNALYRQGKYEEAVEQYQLVTGQQQRLLSESVENRTRLSEAYHNLGNIGMMNKDYAKSVEAYKQSLRLNPLDDETRYNLALAQKLLQAQESQQDQQKDQNEEQQDKQEQDKQDQQQNEQQQPREDQEQKTQEQPQPNEQMSQDNAEQILDAFLQDEKETQEKVKKAQAKQQERRRSDKQW